MGAGNRGLTTPARRARCHAAERAPAVAHLADVARRAVAPHAVAADSGAVRRDDDDDRADGESWIDHVVIPDDISSLDAEVRALRRERRARARRARLRRLVNPRGVVGPLVIVVLLIVAGFASLLMLFQPRRRRWPPPGSAPTSGCRTSR